MEEVLEWINEKVFFTDNGRVFKQTNAYPVNTFELVQRINKRKGSQRGDPRVDLFYKGKRKSCNVSQLVWMEATGQVIPPGYEIHHQDENPLNNEWDNLICIHSLDHHKLHNANTEEIPF